MTQPQSTGPAARAAADFHATAGPGATAAAGTTAAAGAPAAPGAPAAAGAPAVADAPAAAGASPDVLVIGGGVIGAAAAFALAGRGARVTVLERGSAGHETSAVAAGMLSPQAEAEGPSPFLDFGLACRARYGEWVREVSATAAMPIDYRPTAVLNLALTPERVIELQARRDWQRPLGLAAEWLPGEEARRREPILASDLPGALLLPAEAWVDAASLSAVLVAAAKRRGVRFIEPVAVTAIETTGGRVTGVRAGDGIHAAGAVVLAAGAWSSRIAGVPIPSDWITPRRGQLLILRHVGPALRHILYTHGAYVVPRAGDESGNELIVGTTVEEAGYERVATAGGLRSIVTAVARYAPAIEAAPVVSVAAGLRPHSRDGLPLLGPLARLPGLVFATGHFRNGILLAPLSGELVAEAIATGRTPDALAPFLPDRVPEPATR
jgi:glycine oxidase